MSSAAADHCCGGAEHIFRLQEDSMKKSEDKESCAMSEQTEEERVAALEERTKKTQYIRELMFLILLAAASAALLVPSLQMWLKKPGPNAPGMFPSIVSFGMLFCDVIAVIQLLRRGADERLDPEQSSWDKLKFVIGAEVPFTVFVMMAATLLYIAGLSVIGFYISTFVYLAFAILFLYKGDRSKVVQAVAVAAGMDLAVYVIIDLIFQIHMP